MNTPIFTRAHLYSKALAILTVAFLLASPRANAERNVDVDDSFSDISLGAGRSPSSVKPLIAPVPDVIVVQSSQPKKGGIGGLFDSTAPLQELVILNTDKGFVPSTVRLRKGTKYLFHVVNVNPQEKNLSFILDAFSQHQATYYGKVNEFMIEPKKEGVYSFECPETAFEGRMVVFSPPEVKPEAPVTLRVRVPASADSNEVLP